jgi:hypothetical protein
MMPEFAAKAAHQLRVWRLADCPSISNRGTGSLSWLPRIAVSQSNILEMQHFLQHQEAELAGDHRHSTFVGCLSVGCGDF